MNRIGRVLRRRLVSALDEMAVERPDDYARFWEQFGPFIKEGVATDPTSHDDLLNLLRFHSSRDGDELISLSDYVESMGEDQKAIYYILGENLASTANSPHLDYFSHHDIPVLYLVDPIDGFMVMSLREFDGKPLQNVDDADLELPEKEDEAVEKDQEKTDLSILIERFKNVLGERVVDVRESKVLTGSPCRLVSPGDDPVSGMHRVRRLLDQDFEVPKKILEINPHHALLQNLAQLVTDRPTEALLDPAIEQLYDNALLLEGLHPNPAGMVSRVQTLIERAAAALVE
jgi:molecular chaperone HtpG